MRKKEFRKHLRSLKSEAEREEAKAQRAKQAAQKAEILKQAVKLHKANKKMGRREIVERLYTQGRLLQQGWPLYYHYLRHMHFCDSCDVCEMGVHTPSPLACWQL